MANRNLTCIVCPRGCSLCVELDGKNVLSVTGNLCPRGKKYAEDECTHPMRTVTSTVKTNSGGVISVKTDRAIPRENVFDCMKLINEATATLPVHIGDIIIHDAYGANVVATQNMEE